MTKYIENVNAYLSQMKIKQTYVSMKTGIDSKKLSRILTGVQDVNSTDMEKIAKALGKEMNFFLSESFGVPQIHEFMPEKIALYVGNPTEEQEMMANRLVKFLDNLDEVMGAKQRFLNIAKESK